MHTSQNQIFDMINLHNAHSKAKNPLNSTQIHRKFRHQTKFKSKIYIRIYNIRFLGKYKNCITISYFYGILCDQICVLSYMLNSTFFYY